MSKDDEFVQGNRLAKVKFFGFLVLLGALYFYFEFFYETSSPSLQNKQELDDYLRQSFFYWIVFAGLIWILAAWHVQLGLRIKRSGRWPPPGFVVPFKTKIRRGQYVKFAWIASIVSATIMAIGPFLQLYILFRASQIAEMLN